MMISNGQGYCQQYQVFLLTAQDKDVDWRDYRAIPPCTQEVLSMHKPLQPSDVDSMRNTWVSFRMS